MKEQLRESPNIFESTKDTMNAFRGAVTMAIELENDRRRESDEYPLDALSMPSYLLQLFHPENIRRAVERYSSFQYGRHIAHSAFPKFEGHEQAFGWDKKKELVAEGIGMGLSATAIDWGFNEGCKEIGISPELSFSQDLNDKSKRDLGVPVVSLYSV